MFREFFNGTRGRKEGTWYGLFFSHLEPGQKLKTK